MPQAKPYLTSNSLVQAVTRKISFPLSQNSFLPNDILQFAAEEMSIGIVPTVLSMQEEYFVHRVIVPLETNKSRYPIPNRAIGMKFNDLMWSDENGNLFEMTRVNSGDRAYYQMNSGAANAVHKFYIEGNMVVLAPQITGSPTGNLNFFIYIRPNQLVVDERAAIISSFVAPVTVDNALLNVGDTVTIANELFTAVAGSPGDNEFEIGVTSVVTATNLVNAINLNGVVSASNGTPSTNIVQCSFDNIETFNLFNCVSPGIWMDGQIGIAFDSLPSSYTDPYTNVTDDLFIEGALVDFLQTNPGHRTYTFDVEIQSIDGLVVYFDADDLRTQTNPMNDNEFFNIVTGDYICLANECIIPQIPPELHTSLTERTAGRILASIGDQNGLSASQMKLQEIQKSTGELVDNRVDNAPRKVVNRYSPLRLGRNSRTRI